MRIDAQNNRLKVLAAANKLFMQFDVNHVTMAQLAEAAGVGVGTLYRNFPKKGDIVLALAYDQLDHYVAEQQIYLEYRSVDLTAIRHVLAAYLKFRDHRQRLFPNGSLETARRYYQRPEYQQLAALFSQLIRGKHSNLTSTEVTFQADMLIAFLRNESYSLQREERGLTQTDILNLIMKMFFG